MTTPTKPKKLKKIKEPGTKKNIHRPSSSSVKKQKSEKKSPAIPPSDDDSIIADTDESTSAYPEKLRPKNSRAAIGLTSRQVAECLRRNCGLVWAAAKELKVTPTTIEYHIKKIRANRDSTPECNEDFSIYSEAIGDTASKVFHAFMDKLSSGDTRTILYAMERFEINLKGESKLLEDSTPAPVRIVLSATDCSETEEEILKNE